MEDFWKSVQTIQAERGADYRAFSLFSATHWAELLGAAAVIFLCAVIYYRCREVTRHQILRAVFVLMLADNCNARVQQPDGSYVRRMPGADAVDCQAQFYEEAYQANVHSSLK